MIFMERFAFFYSLLLEYSLTVKNGLCSDSADDTVVDDEADCKKAVKEIKRDVPFANFKKTEDDENWPNGCYLYIKTGGVYFNTHSDGSRHNDARQICKSKGKNYYYDLSSIYLL